ncbi:MAG: hypothetical protein P8181_12995 [bacterium]
MPVCNIPGGMPPRSAIAYSFFPLIRTLQAIGLTEIAESEFEDAHENLVALCSRYSSLDGENAAADLAFRLTGRLPFVYSCGGIFEALFSPN